MSKSDSLFIVLLLSCHANMHGIVRLSYDVAAIEMSEKQWYVLAPRLFCIFYLLQHAVGQPSILKTGHGQRHATQDSLCVLMMLPSAFSPQQDHRLNRISLQWSVMN